MDIKNLIDIAKKARENAYAPYSNFKVGAALLAASGKVYAGCNVENISFGLTRCAEQVAILKAVSEGECSFKAISIYADTEDYCSPCGACRQIILEFGRDIEVYMADRTGSYNVMRSGELMPHAFSREVGEEVE